MGKFVVSPGAHHWSVWLLKKLPAGPRWSATRYPATSRLMTFAWVSPDDRVTAIGLGPTGTSCLAQIRRYVGPPCAAAGHLSAVANDRAAGAGEEHRARRRVCGTAQKLVGKGKLLPHA